MSLQVDNYDAYYDFNPFPNDDLLYSEFLHFPFDDPINPSSGYALPTDEFQTSCNTIQLTIDDTTPPLWNPGELNSYHIPPYPSKPAPISQDAQPPNPFPPHHHHHNHDNHQPLTPPTPSSSSSPSSPRRFSTCTATTTTTTTTTSLSNTPPTTNTNANTPPKPRGRKKQPSPTPQQKDERRRKFLERNRLSAQKCRVKKRAGLHEFQERFARLERENAALRAQWGEVKREVDGLRGEVARHVGCGVVVV